MDHFLVVAQFPVGCVMLHPFDTIDITACHRYEREAPPLAAQACTRFQIVIWVILVTIALIPKHKHPTIWRVPQSLELKYLLSNRTIITASTCFYDV